MQNSLSVIHAAQKLAKQHIRKSIEKAVNPISNDIKHYISTLVENDIPEAAEAILMMDIRDIVSMALDFVQVYQTYEGIKIEIQMEYLTGLVESITSMVNHNPEFIEDTLEFFNTLEIDIGVIEGIVVSNVEKVL